MCLIEACGIDGDGGAHYTRARMGVAGEDEPSGGSSALPSGNMTARVSRLLRSVASACDRVAPASWFRSGTPLPLLVFPLWLVPFMLAGVVRYLTRLGMGVSLAVAVALLVGLAATLWVRPRVPATAPDAEAKLLQRMGGLLGLVMVLWTFSLLYSRDMGAMAAYFGPDGGTHIASRRTFADSDPKVYAGFISLYAATALLDRMLSLAPPGSLTYAFYSSAAAVVVVPIVAMVGLLQGRLGQRAPRLVGLAAFSLAWFWCVRSIVLPVLSNMQVDGFYAHFFGFLPFALVWMVDVLFRPTVLRIFWTGLAVLLCRFTYGLNLPELLLTCGVLWLADAARSRRRVLPLLAGAGAAVAGIVAYANLAPVFRLGGYIEAYDYISLPPLAITAVVALAAFCAVDLLPDGRSYREEPAPTPRLLRLVRLPLVCAAISLLGYEQFLRKMPHVETYYLLKYQLMPAIFLAGVACIAIGYGAFLAMSGGARPVLAVVAVAAIFVLGTVAVGASNVFPVWQKEFAERNEPKPHPKLRPLVDPEIWKTVQTTLSAEHKAFGGLISADFVTSHFLNTWMGFAQMWQVFYPPNVTPGHCAFWTRQADDNPTLWNPDRAGVEAARLALEADPQKVCRTYDAPWSAAPHTICRRCY